MTIPLHSLLGFGLAQFSPLKYLPHFRTTWLD